MNDNIYMQSYPYVLQDGDRIEAYARIVADELLKLHRDSDMLAIYTRIDELPEEILDILARDLNVKWYLYDGNIDTKRTQIKSCFYVHRHRGTVAAVRTALTDLYPSTGIEEWFDYNGQPGRFKLNIEIGENGVEVEPYKLYKTLELYKRLSAALEKVTLKKRDELEIKVGIVEQRASKLFVKCEPLDTVYYCDEDGAILTDEDGNSLIAF